MIKRLRAKYTDDELRELYSTPHCHTEWTDHIIRVADTIALAKRLLNHSFVYGADLSCGDGAILSALPLHVKYFGDYAPGYQYVGPIERTIDEIPPVDVFVLSETLEHLDDPLAVLKRIREKTRVLILSTPLNEKDDGNPEHYWGWDRVGVTELLTAASFEVVEYKQTDTPYGYIFQIYGCQ